VQQALVLHPDVVVIDFSMPLMNGIEASTEIIKFEPEMRILLCTMHLSDQLVEAAHQAGIRGAVSKLECETVVDGISALLREEEFFQTV